MLSAIRDRSDLRGRGHALRRGSWFQLHDGETTWPMLLIPIVVGAQRLQLLGTLTVWAGVMGAFVGAALVVDTRLVGARELVGAGVTSLTVAILCGTQSNAYAQQVIQLQRARQQLEYQAGHDVLTGLPNRTLVEQYAAAHGDRAVAVLLLDLNGFKQVNDTLGHAAGDEILKAVARRAELLVRGGDIVARLGGDEFMLLLSDADREAAERLIDRLRGAICQPVDVGGRMVQVGVSIGVACRAAGDTADLQELTAAADAAMYRDKALSRR